MLDKKICLKVSKDDPDVAYLTLSNNSKKLTRDAVSRTVSIKDLIDGYKGADLYLDFDKDGCLIGVEILVVS